MRANAVPGSWFLVPGSNMLKRVTQLRTMNQELGTAPKALLLDTDFRT
jgi:hypothetical protein